MKAKKNDRMPFGADKIKPKQKNLLIEIIVTAILLISVLSAMILIPLLCAMNTERVYALPEHQSERYVYPPEVPYVIPRNYSRSKESYTRHDALFILTAEDTELSAQRYEESLPDAPECDISDEDTPQSNEPDEAVEADVGEQAMPDAGFPQTQHERDIEILCFMVYSEARGLCPEEQALTVWCVLNRLDSGRFGDTIEQIIVSPNQFVYSDTYTAEIRQTVERAYKAWLSGEDAPILEPYATTSDYMFFCGRCGDDGRMHNFFR